MNTVRRFRRISGCVSLVGSSAAAIVALHLVGHSWTVLESPVYIEEGTSFSGTFMVPILARYEIDIECSRNLPFHTLQSILERQLEVTYSLTTTEGILATGRCVEPAEMEYTDKAIARVVTTFAAVPGKQYRLQLHWSSALPELAKAKPYAKVIVNTWTLTDAVQAAFAYMLLAVLLAVGGVLCSLPEIRAWQDRHGRAGGAIGSVNKTASSLFQE